MPWMVPPARGAARSRLIAVPIRFTEVERPNPLWTSQ
jgi:hypothetical protein